MTLFHKILANAVDVRREELARRAANMGGSVGGMNVRVLDYEAPLTEKYWADDHMRPGSDPVAVVELPQVVSLKDRPHPARIAHSPTMTDPKLTEYFELAAALGMNHVASQRLQAELADFLWEQDIPMFDYMECLDYLVPLAEAERKSVVWRPLREVDFLTLPNTFWKSGNSRTHGISYMDSAAGKRSALSVYDKLVPFDVLKNVKTIHDKFGPQVCFYVSDYAVVNPDPFILVSGKGLKPIVFGVWDEPGWTRKA